MTEIKYVTEEMRNKLRAPLPKEAVKPNPTKAHLSTIKPIFVTERLNEVFGIGAWQIRTDLVAPIMADEKTSSKGRAYKEYTSLMKTVLSIPEYNIYYECIAGSSNEDEGDSAKGGTTDGITKICSWMEIGIDVFKGLGDKPQQQTQSKSTTNTTLQKTNGNAPANGDDKPWLNKGDANWNKVVAALKGSFTMPQVEKKYRVSKTNKELLLEEAAQ